MENGFNDEQLAAIGSTAKTTVMPAGPGSGKTRTVVGRVRYQLAHGMDPRELAILTFTNAGAHVFAERLKPIRLNYMGTVHGYCMRLIQDHGHLIGYRPNCVSIVTEEAKKLLLSATRERLGRKITDKELIANQTPYAKLIWQDYRHWLKRANMVDYDQILVDGLELLRWDEVRAAVSLRELLGDELQDSGSMDWEIIWHIPADTRFLVGDADQSIYAFRGGSPEIFIHAATLTVENASKTGAVNLVSGGVEFPLTLNYRSDQAICAAANRLIRHNLNRIDKPIVPVSKRLGLIHVRRFNHEGEEIYGVCGEICELMKQTWAPDEFSGNYDEIAVLARTNSIVEKYRETLRGLGLPIKRVGSVRLPADWSHALTVLSLLVDPANDIHTEEVLRRLGSTEEHIGNMRLRAMRDHVQLSTFVFRNVPQPVTFDDAIRALAFLGVGPESLHLIDQRVQVLPNENPTLSDLLADLWRNDKWNVEDPGVGVTVSTIHAAKGKEWDVVFVVAMEEGILPSKQALDASDDPRDGDTRSVIDPSLLEEERRLAFVAITRARHLLFLSHAAKRTASFGFKELDQSPSRFLDEMTTKTGYSVHRADCPYEHGGACTCQ